MTGVRRLCGKAGMAMLAAVLLEGAAPPARALVTNPHNLLACTKCHAGTPQFGVDSRKTVTYTTSPGDPGLCTSCHAAGEYLHPVGVAAGSGPPGARVSSYLAPPDDPAYAGTVVCTSCHFIHAADGRFGLLRGFPGSPDPRYFASWEVFCRECHGDNLVGRSPHGGGDDACAYCHPAKPRPGKTPEVSARDASLCLLCHPLARGSHADDLHLNEGELVCTHCHDPHGTAGGDPPALLAEDYVVSAVENPRMRPHNRPGFCLACHADEDDYELREASINQTCNRCHDSGKIPPNIHPLRKVPLSITPPAGWPLEDGALTCLTCHVQGHEDQEPTPKLLRDGPYKKFRDVCRRCHSGLDLLSSTIHEDVNAGKGCKTCHKVQPVIGVDTFESVKLIGDPDLLCLRCHEVEADGRHHRGPGDEGFNVDRVSERLPTFRGRVICATCHNPHLLEPANHRLRSGLEALGLCQGCHEN